MTLGKLLSMAAEKFINKEQISEKALDVEWLLSAYTREVNERERWVHRLLWIGVSISGAGSLFRMVALLGTMLYRWGKMPIAIEVFFIFMSFTFPLAALVGMTILWRPNHYTEKLTQLDDKRAIGPLFYASQWFPNTLPKHFIEALMRFLPRLKASDAHLLTSREKDILYDSILPDSTKFTNNLLAHKKYQWIALAAIEQIGDEKALPTLSLLGSLEIRNPQFQEAVAQCSVAVRERAAHKKLSQTLLRASVNDACNATLLKPASPNDPDNANLLRSVI